jgi:hypothetical protein
VLKTSVRDKGLVRILSRARHGSNSKTLAVKNFLHCRPGFKTLFSPAQNGRYFFLFLRVNIPTTAFKSDKLNIKPIAVE